MTERQRTETHDKWCGPVLCKRTLTTISSGKMSILLPEKHWMENQKVEGRKSGRDFNHLRHIVGSAYVSLSVISARRRTCCNAIGSIFSTAPERASLP